MLDGPPDLLEINTEIEVDENISHSLDDCPGHFRMQFLEPITHLAGSLANDLYVVDDPVLDQFVGIEGRAPP